jgi:P27 family predicted phage terminase small subunit
MNLLEPMPAAPDLAAPAYLDERSRRTWETLAPRLAKLGIFTEADEQALAMLCRTWGMWEMMTELLGEIRAAKGKRPYGRLEAGGLVERTKTGFRQLSAYYVVERQLRLDFVRIGSHFGLTPSSRSQVHAGPTAPQSPFWAWYQKKIAREEARLRELKAKGERDKGKGEKG